MRIALFYHSLVSDWNHGNAHFLRGIARELQRRGHAVRIFEPADGWSRENLVRDYGLGAIADFERAFPTLRSQTYKLPLCDVHDLLGDAELAIVHEWNDPTLIAALGEWRRRQRHGRIFFHDTHHRAVTSPDQLARFDIAEYDGVLAYGASLKAAYERLGWGRQVWVWHEAADTRVFYPRSSDDKSGDVVWIGNWGDDERSDEIRKFLLQPIRDVRLATEVYGVRYPETAIDELTAAGMRYRGWIANFCVPEVFARFNATVHIPRRPYTRQLPGIPTIRPFEALACGIPLVSAPWDDVEELFRSGRDFLIARDGVEMGKKLRDVICDPDLSAHLAASGLETIRKRHTCSHRVDELLTILDSTCPAFREPVHTEQVIA